MTTLKTALLGTTLALATPLVHATDYDITVVNLTRGMHFTPLIVAAHAPTARVFTVGEPASAELQAVAEGGDTVALQAFLESVGGTFATADGLLAPGATATFSLSNTATPDNTVLSVASMLLPTNDGFVGLASADLPDGDVGTSVTFAVPGYDAGSEANDEVVGSGAVGEAGFPNPPPVMASGTGVNGSGVDSAAEGFVHVHRNVLGDTSADGGSSDINSVVHRWLNPVARITVTVSGE